MAVPSPWVGGHLIPRGMITFDYAKDPLVLIDENGDIIESPVTSQVFLHVGASFALWSRLGIAVDFPIAVAQSGDDGQQLSSADGAAAGDMRIGLRGQVLGEFYDPFQIGVGAYIYVPSGPSDGYTGDGSVYGNPQLLLGGRLPFLVWSAHAGAIIRGSDNNPHNFTYGAGLGFLLLDEKFQVGPEFFGGVALEDKNLSTNISRAGKVNAEVLLSAKYRIAEVITVGLGGGPGISNGVGTPAFRLLGQIAFDPLPPKEEAPKPPPPGDRDADGIIDAEDACPDVPGVENEDPKKNGCPPDRDGDGIYDKDDACPDKPGPASDDPAKHGCPPAGDRDSDGILDKDDACPDVPGVKNADPKKNGCPPDRDGDGILDKDDACPDVPGVKSADPKKNGCPADRDGDGILDKDDACPDQAGLPNKDPKKNGCPRVIVTAKQIVIMQKIEFDFDKATIKPVSFSLLDDIAKTLKEHPEVLRIEVQGHTDNKGGPFYNRNLSDKRAKAVRAALVQRGVDGKRLTAKGYGQAKPIGDNKTEEGRAQNRRVQFDILKRK